MAATQRRVAVTLFALVVGAVALDRFSLWLWEWRVHRFFAALKEEATLSDGQRAERRTRGEWYLLNVSDTNLPRPAMNLYPVAYTEVVLSRPRAVKPSDVIVDGLGGLHLLYFPPATAWSVRLRHLLSDTDEPLWAAIYAQSYSIDIQWYGESSRGPRSSRPLVRLVHGLRGI
jgi:hypothetical protein